jgi:hypothetical protein
VQCLLVGLEIIILEDGHCGMDRLEAIPAMTSKIAAVVK